MEKIFVLRNGKSVYEFELVTIQGESLVLLSTDEDWYDELKPEEARAIWAFLVKEGAKREDVKERRELETKAIEVMNRPSKNGEPCDVCSSTRAWCDCHTEPACGGTPIFYWTKEMLLKVINS